MKESNFHLWANDLRTFVSDEKPSTPITLTVEQVLAMLDCIDFYRNEMRGERVFARVNRDNYLAARNGEWVP